MVREEEFEALQDSGGVEGLALILRWSQHDDQNLQSSPTLKDARRFAFF